MKDVFIAEYFDSDCTLVPRPLLDFSCSCGEKSEESLRSLLRHEPKMVDTVST